MNTGFKNLEQRLEAQIDAVNQKVDLLKVHTDKRVEDFEARLETHINDAVRHINAEFKDVHIRLDEMDKHTISFEAVFNLKMQGMQNQLDSIYNNYPNRSEFSSFDKRLKKVEKLAFA